MARPAEGYQSDKKVIEVRTCLLTPEFYIRRGFVGCSLNLYNHRLRWSDPHRITHPAFQQSAGQRRHIGNSAQTRVCFVLAYYAKGLLPAIVPPDRNGVTKLASAVRFRFGHQLRSVPSRLPVAQIAAAAAARCSSIDTGPSRVTKLV
jgi:hypothetical protein